MPEIKQANSQMCGFLSIFKAPLKDLRCYAVTNVKGELLANEAMSKHTSLRVGGPARIFYRPLDRNDLANFLSKLATNETILWLGLGTNLLVRDGGIDGVVIATAGRLNDFRQLDSHRIYAEAGVANATIVRNCGRIGLTGVEFLAGIPGTLGGALAMNAGAFGCETWQYVESVETIDHFGVCRTRAPNDFKISYRHVAGACGEWFLAANLALSTDTSAGSAKWVRDMLAKRRMQQPIGLATCGSVFRNPPGDFAGRLIDAAGFKGRRQGGACVSEKHANFIINDGNATALDIEKLIHLIKATVARVHNVDLTLEVRIVGEEINGVYQKTCH